uniref:C-type lectin domain-containing protein n=1 Tax=Monopterus albus TaxID=43700 RepID=A0A3Q3IFT8_MONAL
MACDGQSIMKTCGLIDAITCWMLFKNKCFLIDQFSSNSERVLSTLLILSCLADFVSSYLRELHYPTWIGLSDLVEENQYAWSDGVSPVLYTNWNENDMHASPVFHGTWNDTKCDQAKPYICKITFGTSHTD